MSGTALRRSHLDPSIYFASAVTSSGCAAGRLLRLVPFHDQLGVLARRPRPRTMIVSLPSNAPRSRSSDSGSSSRLLDRPAQRPGAVLRCWCPSRSGTPSPRRSATSFRPFSFSRFVTFASSMSMICFRSSLVRLRKTMMSSSAVEELGPEGLLHLRLQRASSSPRSSPRASCWRTAAGRTASGAMICSAPMFVVMIRIVFLKSTVPADVVGQPAFLHDLQQHVPDVGVGLLDLVEQHHEYGRRRIFSVSWPPSS